MKICLPGEIEPHTFTAPLPPELIDIIEQLRNT
jgi:hypothetical protein